MEAGKRKGSLSLHSDQFRIPCLHRLLPSSNERFRVASERASVFCEARMGIALIV